MGDVKVYDGGIPNQGFNGTYPKQTGGEALSTPNAGPSEIGTDKGGPAMPHGSSDEGVIGDAGYNAPGEERVEGGMKVRDLNDIVNNV